MKNITKSKNSNKPKASIEENKKTRYFKMSYKDPYAHGIWYSANIYGDVVPKSFMIKGVLSKHPKAYEFGEVIEIPEHEALIKADQNN